LFRAGLIVSNIGGSKMRLSKFLALGAAAAGLIVITVAPSDAQRRSTTQNLKSPASMNVKPAVKQGGPTVRDHRKPSTSTATASGGVTVKSTGGKRKSSTCVKSVLGGPCATLKDVSSVKGVKNLVKRTLGKDRDHRK
jgi:hypothetical protein